MKYCYACDNCGQDAEAEARMGYAPASLTCPVCKGTMRRDYAAEGPKCGPGDPEDMVTENGGVLPADVARANRDPEYRRLGVRFDRDGNAHVPGHNREAFYTYRGLKPLDKGGGLSPAKYADKLNRRKERAKSRKPSVGVNL